MTVTILEWEPIVHEPDGIFTTTRTTHRDHSWVGQPLTVTAIQLPFVVVNEAKGARLTGISLDTRRVKLMELKPEFAAAFNK